VCDRWSRGASGGQLATGMGVTAALKQKRSKRAANSLPVSGEGHSFEAATQSRNGTAFTTLSPASKVRS